MPEILYHAVKVTEDEIVKSEFDLLVVGLNNECRSEAILNYFRNSNKVSTRVLCHTQLSEVNSKSLTKGFDYSELVDIKIYPKLADRIKIYQKIINNINIAGNKICIDITGIPVPDLCVIIKIIGDKFPECNITAFYAEPYNYYYEKYLFKNYEYSFGELEVIEVPGYNGSFDRNKDDIMIFILGFEDKVSRYIYTHDEPKKIVAINGFPSSIQKFKDISVINNGILREVSFEKLYYSDAKNPFELYSTLEDIMSDFGDNNYTIVPLGSKPMALGAAIFQRINKNIKLKFPVAESYTYSNIRSTIDVIWEFKIKL